MLTRIQRRSSYNGKTVVSLAGLVVRQYDNRLIIAWLKADGSEDQTIVDMNYGPVTVSDDGTLLAAASEDAVSVWEIHRVKNGYTTPKYSFGMANFKNPTAICVIPAINCVAIGNAVGAVRVCAMEDGYELKAFEIGGTDQPKPVERIDLFGKELQVTSGNWEVHPFTVEPPAAAVASPLKAVS